jgi:hypothetical protein
MELELPVCSAARISSIWLFLDRKRSPNQSWPGGRERQLFLLEQYYYSYFLGCHRKTAVISPCNRLKNRAGFEPALNFMLFGNRQVEEEKWGCWAGEARPTPPYLLLSPGNSK